MLLPLSPISTKHLFQNCMEFIPVVLYASGLSSFCFSHQNPNITTVIETLPCYCKHFPMQTSLFSCDLWLHSTIYLNFFSNHQYLIFIFWHYVWPCYTSMRDPSMELENVEIQACSRLISLTTINNWSCKLSTMETEYGAVTQNYINWVYNSQPCNNIGCWIYRIHEKIKCMRKNPNLA